MSTHTCMIKSSQYLPKSLLLASLLFSTIGMGGSEIRNGGYGVTLQGRLVSLDLAEAGVHANPSLHVGESHLSTKSIIALENITTEVVGKDSSKRMEIEQLLIGKISLINDMSKLTNSPLDADLMIENAERYEWVSHAEQSCVDVKDDNNFEFPQRTQLAYREETYIRFCRDSYRLDNANLTALIIHEIIYASLSAKSKTKEFVGALFSTKSLLTSEKDKIWYLELSEELRTFNNEYISRKQILEHAIKLNEGCYRRVDGICTLEIDDITFNEFGFVGSLRVVTTHDTDSKIMSTFECSDDGVCRNKSLGGKVLRHLQFKNANTIDYYVFNQPVERLTRK